MNGPVFAEGCQEDNSDNIGEGDEILKREKLAKGTVNREKI